jgi:type IV pilus assembly protein PilQ
MTGTRSLALLLTVAAAGALVSASGPGELRDVPTPVRLKTISSRLTSKGASVVIEATEPVAYVATRPDALTVLIDLRSAVADGVANSVVANTKSPIAGVSVEPGDAASGTTSRVRVSLVQPVSHRVRSDRNAIIIDFDKPAASSAPSFLAQEARSGPPPDAMLALGTRAGPPAADPLAILSATIPPAAAPAAQASASAAVQPAAQPATVPASQPGASGRKFTGHPVSLDFQGADLRAVLRTFSEISGLNIVIDPAVAGSVDVALRDVPWDQALDIILRANKLGYIVDGTIVRIAPLNALADEETSRRKLGEEQALAGSLEVLTQSLSYAKGEELVALLTKSALSPRGTVQVDARTNTLIISDLPEKLTIASELIAKLDRPQPQVEIEARIVQANKNYARAIGVQWGFNGKVDPTLGNTTNLAFPNSGSLGGAAAAGAAGVPAGTAVNLPVAGASSAVGLALGSINGAFNLDVALSAAESSGNLRVLSSPRVSAQNNGEAEITQGIQIPIQTIANNTVTVSFKEAALTLKVTPQITAAGTVILKISVENAQADFSRSVNGIPPINTQHATTMVLVNDGQTTVIGGIYVSQEQTQNDKTPGLGQVPILKWLFKRDSVTDQSTELLIFITPRIIKT